jgi:hypothetical protein
MHKIREGFLVKEFQPKQATINVDFRLSSLPWEFVFIRKLGGITPGPFLKEDRFFLKDTCHLGSKYQLDVGSLFESQSCNYSALPLLRGCTKDESRWKDKLWARVMFRLSTYNLLRVSRAAAPALYIERNSIHILARGM